MNEIARPKRASHNGGHPTSIRRLYAHLVTDVDKYLLVPQRDEGEFTKVGVSGEVFEGVELNGRCQTMTGHILETHSLSK